ncbi:ATP-dependent DNA helicase RecG [Sporocytophaga myxococcoides]|uniref:ATP-dependent DNA helicase RecG n=1 Tax=Sporocytophaga myxococcoides TaxID=153721 RepID=A0A098LBU4_9BACT|nr:ATP-dependent DNA helicase RecG [Sporocytophaga myxococcoides]GAL84405.1 ATP-dependent DNA helicase RecG [Sporocytophaga myxococcoides]
MAGFFETRIEFLKGIGPQKAASLNKELSIFTYADLIQHYPFRYEDRSKIYKISEVHEELPYIQIKGRITGMSSAGTLAKKRIMAEFSDGTGIIELVWFQGAKWVVSSLKTGVDYLVYGKPNIFNGKINIAHPEMELFMEKSLDKGLHPVYSTTENLKRKHLDSRAIAALQEKLLEIAMPSIQETLPTELITRYKLLSKKEAMKNIHFPGSPRLLDEAKRRLKFEELFFIQLRLFMQKQMRKENFKGQIFRNIPLLNEFYKNHLPFDLTDAQKRVVREIYKDLCSGKQMNRLLQGDVGSGKTIVAFVCMLMAIDNGAQAALMAPTEILADQHFKGLKEFADKLGLTMALLTGSTKQKDRKVIFKDLEEGKLNFIVGTHALIEDNVKFKNLGIVIIDEQHRFGVAQRAKLWKKNVIPPHILVMTATPIPRTLAMTLYGDLDISVIDELPKGRKPIKTMHQFDKDRIKLFGFMRKQIEEGRQVYVVYPLIEESETLDLKDLMDGYESISRAFPDYALGILHGRMTPDAKDYEMKRFVKGETKILVSTTVIEVGVNVPNASVMVIENAERFGLSQLHQLRGRVGRGSDQSYCILMSNYKLSRDSKVRLETMVKTNNGFEIADVDLKLRGPGDLAGTQQSGVPNLIIADLSQDAVIVKEARKAAEEIIDKDPNLDSDENRNIKRQINSFSKNDLNWSRIS